VCERLDVEVATAVVKGIAKGCELAGCALIGGETAEHPNAFIPHEYDLAGFALGVVEKADIIDGSSIVPGDRVLGLASSGLHANGFSLVRKIIERSAPDLAADFYGRPLGSVLLEPTRIYVKLMLALNRKLKVKGMAHITGGGLVENVPRMLAAGLTAILERDAWTMPPVFSWLQHEGGVAEQEMHRAFNCGIGMAVVVAAADAPRAIEFLQAAGETVWDIGSIEKRIDNQSQTIIQ
jgi:phosphoribosylformylglycinamidine cyclo-ligase